MKDITINGQNREKTLLMIISDCIIVERMIKSLWNAANAFSNNGSEVFDPDFYYHGYANAVHLMGLSFDDDKILDFMYNIVKYHISNAPNNENASETAKKVLNDWLIGIEKNMPVAL